MKLCQQLKQPLIDSMSRNRKGNLLSQREKCVILLIFGLNYLYLFIKLHLSVKNLLNSQLLRVILLYTLIYYKIYFRFF